MSLSPTHLRRYFSTHATIHAELSPRNHHILANRALVAAVNKGIIEDNPARRATGKPRSSRDDTPESVLHNCWGREEALRLPVAARAEGRQGAALYTLALDIGARKGELCGPEWREVDWQADTVRMERSLNRAGAEPIYGRTKGRRARTLLTAPIHCRCSRRVCPYIM